MTIDFTKAFFQFLKMIFVFLFPFMLPFLILFGIIFILTIIRYFYVMKREHVILKRSEFSHEKKVSFFKKLFVQLPDVLARDLLNKDPDRFNKWGIHMICGQQGTGKTITAVYLMQEWKRQFPGSKIYTNIEYKYQDGSCDDLADIIDHNNGKYGCINLIDEIQTWLSCYDRKVPPQVLSEISQQRKQNKALIGTSQIFSKVSPSLREQTHFVYLPHTFFGCLTFVLTSEERFYNKDKKKFVKYTGMFFFVHTKKLRDSYDTLRKVERYKDTGFEKNNFLDDVDD